MNDKSTENTRQASSLLASIIVPTCGREYSLAILAELLALQKTEKNPPVELIIVGNKSSLSGFPKKPLPFPVTLIQTAVRGNPGNARNIAAGIARGEYLVFLDDDTLPSPYWLAGLLDFLLTEKPLIAGGAVFPSEKCSVFYDYWKADKYSWNYPRRKNGEILYILTASAAIKKQIFEQLNGFDSSFCFSCEDMDLSLRARKNNIPLLFSSALSIYHKHPSTLFSIAKKFFFYGLGNALLIRHHNTVEKFHKPFSFIQRILNLSESFKKANPLAYRYPLTHLTRIAAYSAGLLAGFILYKTPLTSEEKKGNNDSLSGENSSEKQ